jgi:hypothetical protein
VPYKGALTYFFLLSQHTDGNKKQEGEMFWDWPEEAIRDTSGIYVYDEWGEQELNQYVEDYCQN